MAIDYDKLKQLQEIEELRKKLLKEIEEQSMETIKPAIEHLKQMGDRLKETDKQIKNLQEQLSYTKTQYSKQLSEMQNYYKESLSQVNNNPEYKQMFDRELEKEDPYVFEVVHQDVAQTAKKVTKFLRNDATLIDPATGLSFSTWKEAADYYKLNVDGDSAKRVFERNRKYPLIPLTSDSASAVTQCVETPGCVEETVGGYIKYATETKDVDNPNKLLDSIFDFLKTHKQE